MEFKHPELLARNDLNLARVVKNHLEGKIISLINKAMRQAKHPKCLKRQFSQNITPNWRYPVQKLLVISTCFINRGIFTYLNFIIIPDLWIKRKIKMLGIFLSLNLR